MLHGAAVAAWYRRPGAGPLRAGQHRVVMSVRSCIAGATSSRREAWAGCCRSYHHAENTVVVLDAAATTPPVAGLLGWWLRKAARWM